ncbi:MAG: sodium:solute symporter, partial [Bacteroidota bacterium]
MKNHPLFPSLLLLLLLGLIGLGLYFFTDYEVLWSGFVTMMIFYALIFFAGTYVAQRNKTDDASGLMLAGRSIPLGIAIFTMSATW